MRERSEKCERGASGSGLSAHRAGGASRGAILLRRPGVHRET